MFVNFDKAFNQKPSSTTKIPDAMISYLNKSLPHGVKYRNDNDGSCSITTDEGPITIGGFSLIPSGKHKKVLGKNYKFDDIFKYSYNSQQPIPLKLNKSGVITINGKEFPVEKIKYNPYKQIKYVSGTFMAIPAKFPPPFEIEISSDNYRRKLNISRVPNDSLHVVAFESEGKQPFTIKYFFNEATQGMTMTVSFNLKYAKTIRDIVESISIYNAYIDGKVYLCGSPLDAKCDQSSQRGFDDKSAQFWEKVLKIEEYLKLSFVPPQKDTDYDTICMVEQLYQNLINLTPTRNNQRINSVDGKLNMESKESIDTAIGKPLFFEFSATSKFDLFGIKFELHCIIGIFNSILSDYYVKDEKYTLLFSDESERKPMFTSIMCFKTEEALEKYKVNHDKLIEVFSKAKKPSEYLE